MRALKISGIVILLDQISKVIVLNTMQRSQSIEILGDWLKFTFTENPGMAFGIQYGPPALITIFSIVATGVIVLYMRKVGHIYAPYYVSLCLVLGGALGNIIDRVLYAKILYGGPLFVGKVVDFVHVNLWRGFVPESYPLMGGKFIALFPIWNVADMAIVLGVIGILFYQKRFHEKADVIATGAGSKDETAGTESPTSDSVETQTD